MHLKSVIFINIIAAVVLLGSCSFFQSTSISDRVAQFEKDLNTPDRANMIDNFSEKSCQDYNLINDPSYWDTNTFFTTDKQPYSLSVAVDGQTTASGTITFSPSSSKLIFFELVNDGTFIAEDWKITNIWLDAKDDSNDDHQIRILTAP